MELKVIKEMLYNNRLIINRPLVPKFAHIFIISIVQ